ncbi:MAG: HaeII family restriction endonuclease [Nitrospira sp. LK70]|nr:HaeII family restriction endonuclease [Nitrospira sp. LK70]
MHRREILRCLWKSNVSLWCPEISWASEIQTIGSLHRRRKSHSGLDPLRIEQHVTSRLGVVPSLHDAEARTALATDLPRFLSLIREQISKSPANFEIFSFAVLKVHLENFACKIYRDTRTAAHDQGVDLSTNFGVVYQVKKLRIHTELEAAQIYGELKRNFDNERIQNGNVVLVIDDISKEVQRYLVDMKVQLLKKEDVLKLASNFDDQEDRQKV